MEKKEEKEEQMPMEELTMQERMLKEIEMVPKQRLHNLLEKIIKNLKQN